jgi:hypothetical protein
MNPAWIWIYRAWLEAAADNQPTCYSSRIDGAIQPAYARTYFGDDGDE